MSGKMIQGLVLALCMQSAGVAVAQTSVAAAPPKTALTWEQSVADVVKRGGLGDDGYWRTLMFIDISKTPRLVDLSLSVHVSDISKGKVVLFQIDDPRMEDPKTGSPKPAIEHIYVTDTAGRKLYKAEMMTANGGGWRTLNPKDKNVLKNFAAMKKYWLESPLDRFETNHDFDDDVAITWKQLVDKARKEGYEGGGWKTLNVGSPSEKERVVEILSVGIGPDYPGGTDYAGKVILCRWEMPTLTSSMSIQTVYVTDVEGRKLHKVVKRLENKNDGNGKPEIKPLDETNAANTSAFISQKNLWQSVSDLWSNSGVAGDFNWVFEPPTSERAP